MPRTLEVTIGPGGALVVARDRPTTPDRWVPVLVGLFGATVVLLLPVVPLVDALRRPAESAPTLLAIGAGAALAGLALGLWAARRIRLGRWRLDGAGVTWNPRDAPAVALAWGEVARVRWWPNLVTLEGPAGRVEWTQVDFRPDDWRALRARVEAGLTPRFDLAGRRPCDEFRPGRVLLLVAPIGLLAAWFARALPTLTINQMYASVYAMLALLILPILYICSPTKSNRQRLDRAWRVPRPPDQGWNSV